MQNWLMVAPRHDSRCRLFCLHHAGGGGSLFAPWLRPAAAAGVEVLPIQLPGRENRYQEPLIPDVQVITQQMAASLMPLLDRPFAVFGHSLGGILAFETIRELRRRSAPMPQRVMISAVAAPQLRTKYPSPTGKTDDEFLASVLERYGNHFGSAPLSADLKAMYLPVLVADFRAINAYDYQPEPPLDLPLRIFGGREDTTVGPEELAAWQGQSTRPIQMQTYSGGHFYLRRQPQILDDILTPSDSWPV